MPRNQECQQCKLSSSCHNPCIWGVGNKRPVVMFVGSAPTEHSDKLGKPVSSLPETILRRWISQLGLGEKDYYITNAVKCLPTTKAPREGDIAACNNYLEEEILICRPQFIVMLGEQAIRAVTGKREAVKSARGRCNWYHDSGAKLLATWHPSRVLDHPRLSDDVVDDLNRIAYDDFVTPETVRWEYVREVKKLPSLLAYDLETIGINPWGKGKILCVSWSASPDKAYVTDDIDGFVLQAQKQKCELIGHNIKFDILWPYSHIGPMLEATHDTKLMAHLLNENDATGLKYLAGQLTGYGDWLPEIRDKLYKGLGEEVPRDKLYEYCSYDSAATFRLFRIFLPELRKQGLLPLYTAYMQTINTFCRMEATGLTVDREMLEFLTAKYKENIEELNKRIQRKVKEYGTFNLGSSKQMQQLFFGHLGLSPVRKTKTGASVDEATLRALYNQQPENMGKTQFRNLLDTLLEHRGAEKILSTYLEGIEKRLDKTGGNTIHATFSLTNSVSRVACSGPNLQNIPRDANAPVKMIYVPEKGNILVAADYSQIEMRIGAIVTGDDNMLGVIRSGVDLHDETARKIFGDDFTTEQRVAAKTINFGVFYGMGAKTLAEKLGTDIREARRFLRAWYDTFPGVKRWQEGQKQTLQDHGYVTSMFGRRRRLPTVFHGTKQEYAECIRQACNFPVQSPAVDITLFAMNVLRELFGYTLCCTVHDSVMLEVADTGMLTAHLKQIEKIMVDASRLCEFAGFPKIKIDVPTPVDIEYGDRWGEMKQWNEDK